MKPSEYVTMKDVEGSHWWYRGLRSMLRGSFPRFDDSFDGVILDAGCGTGANLREIRGLAPQGRLIGTDLVTDALKWVPANARANLCQADVNHFPIADRSVDLLVSCDLLGQRGVLWPAAIAAFYRVLKPGGVLMLNVPAFHWLRGEHDAAVHVDKRFGRAELHTLLLGAGFQDIRCNFWNSLLMLPMLVRRLAGRMTHSGAARSDLRIIPYGVNSALSCWIELETKLAVRGFLPLGSSIFATARRSIG